MGARQAWSINSFVFWTFFFFLFLFSGVTQQALSPHSPLRFVPCTSLSRDFTPFIPRRLASICGMYKYVVVVLTSTHRYNAVRGHRAGSNNSETENYLRRKTNKTEVNTHNNWNNSYTSDTKMISAYVRITKHILYHTSMLNKSQQKPKPRRQHSTHKKTGWNKRCPNRSRKKGRKRRKKLKASQHQQRKTEDTTHTSGSQGARGGCSAGTK